MHQLSKKKHKLKQHYMSETNLNNIYIYIHTQKL